MAIVQTIHFDRYSRLAPARLEGEFRGKHVLITGGGYGIGASIARSFAEAGVGTITIAGRTAVKLDDTVAELRSEFRNTNFSSQIVDIASADSVKNLFESLTSPVDVLVNNAGFLPQPENFIQADLKEWWAGFEINVLGTAIVTQAYLQSRVKLGTKSDGVVLTMNTIAAYNILAPTLSSYAASKAAAWRMIEMIGADVAAARDTIGSVRFINIHPGFVRTAMGLKSGLDGAFPVTNPGLASDFVAWAASVEAGFLDNRLVWVNWDIDELVAKKQEILDKDLLRTAMSE